MSAHRHRAAPASETLLGLPPPRAPEDRLLLAMLLDAVAVLREHVTGVSPHDAQLIASTVRWFTVPDDAWLFSFANVCRALGLDPAELRAALSTELADLGARGLLAPPRPRVVPLRPTESGRSDTPAAAKRRS